MNSAVASVASHQHGSQPDPDAPSSGSWRWNGVSWSPTYSELSFGFDDLVGAVDRGCGVASSLRRTSRHGLSG